MRDVWFELIIKLHPHQGGYRCLDRIQVEEGTEPRVIKKLVREYLQQMQKEMGLFYQLAQFVSSPFDYEPSEG